MNYSRTKLDLALVVTIFNTSKYNYINLYEVPAYVFVDNFSAVPEESW